MNDRRRQLARDRPSNQAAEQPRCRAVVLFTLYLAILFVVHPTYAAVKKHPHKPTASKAAAKPAGRRSRSSSRAPQRAAPAPDISPERGTAAAEAAQATLAETPIAPFLYPHHLVPFFRALATLQSVTPTPTVRILQFGDSHTAADLFTGELRTVLQTRFGNGGLGFQFPGHPFAGYRLAGSTRSQTPGWFTEGNKFTHLGDGDLGLGGISISTARPGESISLSTTCATLQVQYLRQPEGGRLRFLDNGTYISEIATSTDAAAAPAPSAGTLTYACTPGVHDFQLTTLDHAPVRLLGVVTEQPGITYECLGINGAVAPLMLRWDQALFADYLRQRDPSLIVLAYGTNEAAQSAASNGDYVAQFHSLLQNLHRIVPQAAILVLGPYDRATRQGRGHHSAWATYLGTDRIIADQKEACRVEHCAFYDERARMGGAGAMLRWASAGLAQPDRTHLTGTGYRALADALSRDLVAAYQTWQQSNRGNPSSAPAVTRP
jgi:lysophospholipase L1-like esterase